MGEDRPPGPPTPPEPGSEALAPVDPWSALRRLTPARIALGRSGAGLPTREVLDFSLAHARARDAVHAPFAADRLAASLGELGLMVMTASSAVADRAAYLRRPDLGRRLAKGSRTNLLALGGGGADLVLVVGDGLSAVAVETHAVPVIAALLPLLGARSITLGPAVVTVGARVALADEIGELLGAAAVAILIGERPGLSAPDSLGVYFTWAPRVGRTDAERNCISNIRSEGLSPESAAAKLAWLIDESRRRQLSGVSLKDESDLVLVEAAETPVDPPI